MNIYIDTEKCTGCQLCVKACPYGAIRCQDGQAQKCELCGGEPECVRFCAPGALRYEPEGAWSPAARQAYADRLRDLMQEVNA